MCVRKHTESPVPRVTILSYCAASLPCQRTSCLQPLGLGYTKLVVLPFDAAIALFTSPRSLLLHFRCLRDRPRLFSGALWFKAEGPTS